MKRTGSGGKTPGGPAESRVDHQRPPAPPRGGGGGGPPPADDAGADAVAGEADPVDDVLVAAQPPEEGDPRRRPVDRAGPGVRDRHPREVRIEGVQALDDAVAAGPALVKRVAEASGEGERAAAAPDGDAAVSRRSGVVGGGVRVRGG